MHTILNVNRGKMLLARPVNISRSLYYNQGPGEMFTTIALEMLQVPAPILLLLLAHPTSLRLHLKLLVAGLYVQHAVKGLLGDYDTQTS